MQYDIQTVGTTVSSGSITSGTFQLVFDTQRASGGYLDGTRTVTAPISFDADAKTVKDALELLANVDTVDVSESAPDTDGTKQWTVTFKTNLGSVPMLALETGHTMGVNAGVQISRDSVGVTEIQTISTAASSAFVREEQTFSIHGTGTFTITFDNAVAATIDTNDLTVSSVQAAIDSLDTIGLAAVSAGADATTFVVEFLDPVGDVAKLEIDEAGLSGCGSGPCSDVVETRQGFSPLGGTFVVSFLDEYTDNLDFDASEDEVKFELEKLSTVGKVDVMREDLGNGHRWTVTFLENLGNIPMMIAHPTRQEIQYIESYGGSPTPLEGSFTLAFGGETSEEIPFDATEETMKASIEALSTVGVVTVNRDGPLGGEGFGRFRWRVTFRSNLGPLENMVVDYSNMAGTDARVDVTTFQIGSSESLTGLSITPPNVEEKVAGLPSYTGSYTPEEVGTYALATRQLIKGGLHADYFDNEWLEGAPSISRVDSTINMNWLDGYITPYGKDYVSARWHGKVRPTTTELYTIHVVADDGVRLWIDHTLVVDAWESSGTEKRAEVSFTAGAFHDIKMEYKEVTGPALVSLSWSSNSISRQVIPSSAFYRAEHIVGSPHEIIVVPGAADYPYTTAYGQGLETPVAGIDAVFTIQSRDARGNNKTEGGDVFDVQVIGPDKLTVTPTYVGDGKYECVFVAAASGAYDVEITIGGTHIYCGMGSSEPCSPFSIVVAPGPTSHETTVATGPGLSNAVAGVVSSFDIQAKDTYGNNRLVGGDEFDIKLVHKVSGATFGAIVDDNNDGTYAVTYTVLEAGMYQWKLWRRAHFNRR